MNTSNNHGFAAIDEQYTIITETKMLAANRDDIISYLATSEKAICDSQLKADAAKAFVIALQATSDSPRSQANLPNAIMFQQGREATNYWSRILSRLAMYNLKALEVREMANEYIAAPTAEKVIAYKAEFFKACRMRKILLARVEESTMARGPTEQGFKDEIVTVLKNMGGGSEVAGEPRTYVGEGIDWFGAGDETNQADDWVLISLTQP